MKIKRERSCMNHVGLSRRFGLGQVLFCFETDLAVMPSAVLNSLCSRGWPGTCHPPPAPTSQVLLLLRRATTAEKTGSVWGRRGAIVLPCLGHAF